MVPGLKVLILALACLFHGEHDAPRSSHWSAIQRAHLAQEPTCVACGTRKDLNVHHICPFSFDPSRELDPTNLITLCREHHLHIGHAGNFKHANPYARRDAVIFHARRKHADFKQDNFYAVIKARAVTRMEDWPKGTR